MCPTYHGLCLSCSPSCDVSYIALPCIHVLHCCISSRYVRCMTRRWRAWCCNQPKDDVGGRIQKMEVPWKYMSGKRCSSSEYHLTNTDLVLHPWQALEHSKPPTSHFKIHLSLYFVLCIKYRSWIENHCCMSYLVYNIYTCILTSMYRSLYA